VIAGKRDRLEPELAHHALAADVYVLRLMTLPLTRARGSDRAFVAVE
jgi:hypothetical protein